MKSIFFKISAVIFCTAFIFGFSTVNAEKPQSKLQKTISDHVKYPAFASEKKTEGVVEVKFTVNTDGTIAINGSNSLQEDLRTYVVNELSNLKVEADSETINKNYLWRFEFKML